MPILRDDPDRVGFAILWFGTERDCPLSVSIQFLDHTFLGSDGRRSRERHFFGVDPRPEPGTCALGPAITAHVPEAEIVALADEAGMALGTVSWDGIRSPPRMGHGTLVGAGRSRVATTVPAVRNGAGVATAAFEGNKQASSATASVSMREGPLAPLARRWRRTAALAILAILLLAVGLDAGLVLSGRIGWDVDTHELSFSGGAGGAFRPDRVTARLRALWYAKPFAIFTSHPFAIGGAPPWLVLNQEAAKPDWTLQASISAQDAGPPGERRFAVPIVFPIAGGPGHDVVVTLRVLAPLTSPAQPPAPTAPPVAVATPSTVDDVACDRVAGNRFDPDHPADQGSVDEIFDLPIEMVEKGIGWCDPSADRVGADRRFIVQRGRLLAARALSRAATGDLAGARQDMDAAVAAWHVGSSLGSAFADSLLGTYAFGSFNRPSVTFVQPDDVAATEAWQQGMARGSAVAERNYAAQLLAGHGIAADPVRALVLLRDALGRGDERAAGVLGVARYTGFPAGVPVDKAEGWSLIVRAQCIDKASADLLAGEIQRGARPASDRRPCS